MASTYLRSIVIIILALVPHRLNTKSIDQIEALIQCLQDQKIPTSQVLTPKDPSFNATLFSSMQNDRFAGTASWPALIVSPMHESHVRASVVCGRRHGLPLRARSGGHDFEGLSYRSLYPEERFVMIDLANLRSIDVDVKGKTAWVEAGATIGELYYEISRHSDVLGFPAGAWPTVGVGGQFSGGGAGFMIRKFGLAADNVMDARIVDVSGQLLDRDSMGEDLFWAIRGGGGASFGIVLSYKIELVDVPPVVTVFSLTKGVQQGATKLISKWQHVAPRAVNDLHLFIALLPSKDSRELVVRFQCLFLGRRSALLPIMEESFPELGLKFEDYKEMSWIESILYYALLYKRPVEDLLDRRPRSRASYKSKMDSVEEPISERAIEGILRWLTLHGGEASGWRIDIDANGGRMDEIPEYAIPYPHRKGSLYKIVYTVSWTEPGEDEVEKNEEWIKSIYEYMTPYVSKDPRCAYYNVKDLDLGWNKDARRGTYEEARVWGSRYFKGNFERLAMVKARVDPENYFWSEQSIPPYHYNKMEL